MKRTSRWKRASIIAVFSAVLLALAVFPGCRNRIVWTGPGDWITIAEDPDEQTSAYNADSLFIDADLDDDIITFKIGTYAPIPSADSVFFAVYIDADQNSSTGLSSTTDFDGFKPNSIGADYLMTVGAELSDGGTMHTDLTYNWGDTIWDSLGLTISPYRAAGADSVLGGISRTAIGNPSVIDVEALLICAFADVAGGEYRDLVPNTGHITIDLDSGTVTLSTPLIAGIYNPPPADKRYSIITGKEITMEAR